MSGGRDETVTVFLGDLSRDATKEDVEKTFSYYGKLRNVWLSRSPWGYGFIDFEDQRDAADAVKALDGKMICGSRVRVEFSHGRGRSNRGGGRSRRRSGSRSPRSRKPFSPHDICYECGDRGHYAYDCEIRLRRQRRMRSTSRSRSPRRKGNGNPSRRKGRSRSRSGSSRSGSGRGHSNSRSRSHSRSYSRSRSNSSSQSEERRSHSRTRSRSRYCSNVTNINECAANDRICGSFTCINLPGDYKCDCDFFHSGKRCQKISGIGLFVLIISSIVIILIIGFLILFAIRTFVTYRLSRRVSRERELQLQNPCMATLTTGGMMGDDPLGNGSSYIRPVGHRIYVPMETSFANATRVQASLDDDDKKQISPPPPKYDSSNFDQPIDNIISTEK
ncbi:unnamed protein product [Rotaria sordida]|uniref:Serine/arginine-rich splicing factor 7 n=2 Tax=Rotaria sordida TaxID=392033 RepID=A0A814NXL1_9BILA|nr:unnamed protein product [Rotaria sordida]CAF1097198.1 unnamed protein product [Rotaria sordida]